MPKTVANDTDRRALLDRLARLTPETQAQWGKFNASRMLVHVTDALRSATGDLKVASKGTPFSRWPLNTLVMFHLPWPKGSPTAPELLARKPEAWDAEITRFRQALEAVAKRSPDGQWPVHAAFGNISGADWARLMYRHIDHHFTQFGV